MATGYTRPRGVHGPALYFIGLGLGVVVTILDQHDFNVRFAGIENVLLSIVGITVWMALAAVFGNLSRVAGGNALAALIVRLPLLAVGLAFLITWLAVMVMAILGMAIHLPVIGSVAFWMASHSG